MAAHPPLVPPAMVQQIRYDALLNFSYDPRTGDYRYSKGESKGQKIPKVEAMDQIQRYQHSEEARLVALADRELPARDFYRIAKDHLKNIYVAQFLRGVGGYEHATDGDWLKVASLLKEQYYQGKGDDGKPFGLKHLAKELQGLSPAMVRHRLSLYARSGNHAYWLGRQRSAQRMGYSHGLRVLGRAEHCPDCVAYAAMAPRLLHEVILPGQKCECRSNCKCSIRFLTLEQAVRRGGKPPALPTVK